MSSQITANSREGIISSYPQTDGDKEAETPQETNMRVHQLF